MAYRDLIVAVYNQALSDVQSADPLQAVDALLWLLDEWGGVAFTEALGIYQEPEKVLMVMAGGYEYGQPARWNTGSRGSGGTESKSTDGIPSKIANKSNRERSSGSVYCPEV